MKQEIAATLLFLDIGDQLLLAMKKRGFGANRYNGVGGKPEADETIEQTLIREAQEEVGVTPTEFEKVAKITFDEYFKGEPATVIVHTYFATRWEGTPRESEEMAPKWFDKDKIPFDKMWPDDIYWLPKVLAGKKIKAHFKLDKNDAIISHDIKEVKGFKN